LCIADFQHVAHGYHGHSYLHHATAKAAWRWGASHELERFDQNLARRVRGDDRVHPPTGGAVADVGLLDVAASYRLVQIVELFLRQLLSRALGLSFRKLE
jgi:hypothetical protein